MPITSSGDYVPKYLKNEQEWRLANNITKPTKGYLDNTYLEHVIAMIRSSKGKKEAEYKEYIAELLDLIVRMAIQSPAYNAHPEDIKEEFYGEAFTSAYNVVLRFDPSTKSKAFSFLLTTITNTFKSVLSSEARKHTLNSKVIIDHRAETMFVIDDPKQSSRVINYIQQENGAKLNIIREKAKNNNNLKKEYPTVDSDTLEEEIHFYDTLLEDINERMSVLGYGVDVAYNSLRLLTHQNLPCFKRKYRIFNRVLDFNNKTDTKEPIKMEPLAKQPLIVVEMQHLKNKTENEGISATYIRDRVFRVRNNGFQYFGIYSDDWYQDDVVEQAKMRKMIVDMIVKMYNKSISEAHIVKRNYDASKEYILPSLFMENKEHFNNTIFYGVDDNRDKRRFIDPTIKSYMRWLDVDSENTRIYDFGWLKLPRESQTLKG